VNVIPSTCVIPRDLRDNVDKLRVLPVIAANGSQIALGELADIVVTEGPPMLKSENARCLTGFMSICAGEI
jgi:Cu/Ag efflux pump CusA